MIDPTSQPPSVPPAEPPEDTLEYRPLSGLAVASLIIACAYALLLSYMALASWFLGTPLFLGSWTLLVPATAIVLALAAQRQIRRSEGTRAGAALAVWGFRLSLVFGLCYGAYFAAVYTAMKWKAQDFTEDWFRKLQKGDVYAAFWDTVNPNQREGVVAADKTMMQIRFGNAPDGKKGPLIHFQESELVRLVKQAGSQATWQELGIREWTYESQTQGYRVEQTYRLTTPEGEFDLLIRAHVGDDRGRRQILWFGDDATILRRSLTPQGEAVQQWKKDALRFISEWIVKKGWGDRVGLYFDTLEPAERERQLREFHVRLAGVQLSAGAASAADFSPGASLTHLAVLSHPESLCSPAPFREFLAGGLVRTEGEEPEKWKLDVPKDLREQIVKDVKESFRLDFSLRYWPNSEDRGYLIPKEDRLRVTSNVTLIPLQSLTSPDYVCDARVVVESDPGPITSDRSPRWRVVSVELIRGYKPEQQKR